MRARSALFTLFGDVVLPAGGEAWLGTLTACMGTLGFTPQATRTALHRMTAEGWVQPRRAGRHAAYRLTPRGVDRLQEAAARIYRLRAAPWDGRWRVLLAPALPAHAEAELAWMGFGRLSPDAWVSPGDHPARLEAVLAEHGLTGATLLVAEISAEPPSGVAARAWDLASLAERYAAFLAEWQDAAVPDQAADAFAMRARLVHEWRKFLFIDPGLPDAVLPARWIGHRAAGCFRDRYEAATPLALAFHAALAADRPGAPAPVPSLSPFAQGLAALATLEPRA